MANRFRRILMRIGKFLPFALCFIVLLSYLETIYAVCNKDYRFFYDCVVINKPLSFFIAEYFEYDMLTVLILLIVSIAVEACKWNLLAILYLAIQLSEKFIFNFEMSEIEIGCVSAVNILVSGFLVVKGVKILFAKNG